MKNTIQSPFKQKSLFEVLEKNNVRETIAQMPIDWLSYQLMRWAQHYYVVY
jgi:hypothetical protein